MTDQEKCQQPLPGGYACNLEQGHAGEWHFADVRETDRNGVEFSSNCLTPGTCRLRDLCLGTCKLY